MKSILPWTAIALVLLLPSAQAQGALIAVEYASDSPVYSVNTTDGSLTPIGLSGYSGLNSLAKDSTHTIYSVGTITGTENPCLITIDPLSGRGDFLTEIDFGGFRGNVKALAFSPLEVLYASVGRIYGDPIAGFGAHDLFTIDITTGRGSYIGPLGGAYLGLDFARDGTLYGWEATAGLAKIDTLSGIATDVNPAVSGRAGSFYGGLHLQTIAFSFDGKLYGDTQFGLFTIDTDTGIPKGIGSARESDVRGMEFIGKMTVPEPSAAILLISYGVPLYLFRRIRAGRVN